MSVLIGTFAVALFNASKDPIASKFAYLYALISVGILVRILLTLRKKYLSIFSSIHPPIVISYRCMGMSCTNVASR